jgi:hypothetical protein
MQGRIFAFTGRRVLPDHIKNNDCTVENHVMATALLRIASLATLLCVMTACGARAHIVARNPALTLAPTCADAVAAYGSRDKVPYDYYEVALITGEANSVYAGNGDVLKSVRKQAASLGANGVVVDSLGATHATVKILGAALGGKDAERKAQAIAIWMPSDTARVREACSGG